MDTSRRGNIAVLFINIIEYQKTEKFNREGAVKDERYLREVFAGCRFLYYINLKAKKLRYIIHKFVTSSKNKRFENLVLIIGAHGTRGVDGEAFLAFDEKKIEKEEIIRIFERTRNLRDKIITCILQTCRGGSYDMETAIIVPQISPLQCSIPQMTIVNVTQPDTKSFRSRQNGSFFFQSMYSVFLGKKRRLGNFRDFFEETCSRLKKLLPLGIIQKPHLESNFYKY